MSARADQGDAPARREPPPERLQSARLRRLPDFVIIGAQRRSYAKRGLYLEQLERWLAVFPRERFLILKSEDLYDDPERIVHQTLAFLGLPPWTPSDFAVHNSGRYPPMDPATRKRLAEYFAPHNRRLYAFLGRDLGWEDE